MANVSMHQIRSSDTDIKSNVTVSNESIMCINLRSETHRNKVKDKSSELCAELIQLYLKALYNKETIHLL